MKRAEVSRVGWLRPAAVLAALVVACALVAARSSPARAQQAADPSLLQTLAERLLGSRGPAPTAAPLPVQLLPGALPADLPLDLPLPDGSTLIGSAVAPSYAQFSSGPFPPPAGPPSAPTGETTDIVVDAPGAPADILAFYQSALSALGWTPPSPNRSGPGGGFLPSFLPQYTGSFCQNSSGPWLSITVFPSTSGPNDLRLHVETGNPGPCSGPNGFPLPAPPPGSGLLPPLHSPADVQVLPSGGSGGPGRFGSDATATTMMAAGDLEAFYEQQLIEAGWTRIDGHDDGLLTWSTWSVPSTSGPNDWQGFLLVRDGPGAGELSLHVEVASPSQMTGGASFSMATATSTSAAPVVPTPAPAAASSGG